MPCETSPARKVLVLGSTLQCQESTSGRGGQAAVGQKLLASVSMPLGWDRALPTWLPRGGPHCRPGPCPESFVGSVFCILSSLSASQEGKSWVLWQASLSSPSFPAHLGATKCSPHAIIPGSFPSFSRSPQTPRPSKTWRMLSPGSRWRRVSLELASHRALRGSRGVSREQI